MKKFLIVLAVLAVAGFFGYKKLDSRALEAHSRERVEGMLKGLQAGTLADEQEAMGYWRIGHPEPASDANANAFARFRGEGQLGEVKSFTIVSTQLIPASSATGRSVEISATINGKPVRLRAKHKQPLEWIP